MKLTHFLLMGAMLMATGAANAQESDNTNTVPQKITGYFRLNNPGYGDVLTANNRFDLTCAPVNPTQAGSIMQVRTNKLWSFAEEHDKLMAEYGAGEISKDEFTTRFNRLMNVDSWKGGMYPVAHLEVQGVDYAPIIQKLSDYCDDAIESFLNDELADLYEKYRTSVLLQLCIFASDVISPSNIASLDTFRAWAERYLTNWKSVTDFNLYLHIAYNTPENDSDPREAIGYYLTFKTPVYVGNMKKAQEYINNMVNEDGTEATTEKLDFWRDAKKRVLAAVAKDYPEGSPAYNLLKQLMDNTESGVVYIIGENENGTLYTKGLPDAFGTNGETLTEDDIAKCLWQFSNVDEQQPYAIDFSHGFTDADNFHYTTLYTSFPYEVKSAGTQVFYANAIDTNGEATLVEITDGKVPERTAVIVKSLSAEARDNYVVPVFDGPERFSDNVLQGVYFANENAGDKKSFVLKDGKPAFTEVLNTLPANSAYFSEIIDGIQGVHFNTPNTLKIYDLQGHQLQHANRKGIYIVNGKKFVR